MSQEADYSDGIPQFLSPDELKPPVQQPRTTPSPANPSKLVQSVVETVQKDRPASQKPIVRVNTLTDSTGNYVKVVEWIPEYPGGILKEISVSQDPNALYRIVVSGDEQFKDVSLQAALTLPFDREPVPGGPDTTAIQVFAKTSKVGTAITVSGEILGEQVLA